MLFIVNYKLASMYLWNIAMSTLCNLVSLNMNFTKLNWTHEDIMFMCTIVTYVSNIDSLSKDICLSLLKRSPQI